MEFHHACRGHGIKPITGVELRLSPSTSSDSLVVLARGHRGYRALCRIVTSIARPSSDRMAAVVRHFDDLLVLATSENALARLLDTGISAGDAGLLANAATPANALSAARQRRVPLVFDSEVPMPRESDRALLSLSSKIFGRRRRQRGSAPLSAAALGADAAPGFEFENAELAGRCARRTS